MGTEALGSNVVCQVAVVVRDIEKTARAYAEIFGVPAPQPRETETAEKTNIKYKGETTAGRAKLAFFNLGQVSLELIEPIGGPSTWQEHLDARGEGVHHIAFRVEDMDRSVAMLDAKGCPTVQRGDFKGGCYAYVDATKDLKVVLELLASTPK
ncbi:MAG: VOC family protein [Planctomycetota bacterium]|nr:VOC family protein [Planctomycetota bacterium]